MCYETLPYGTLTPQLTRSWRALLLIRSHSKWCLWSPTESHLMQLLGFKWWMIITFSEYKGAVFSPIQLSHCQLSVKTVGCPPRHTPSQRDECEMTSRVWKEAGWSGRGLFEGNVPAFVWMSEWSPRWYVSQGNHCWPQWSCGQRSAWSTIAGTLRSRVRIPCGSHMCVRIFLCR